MTQTEIEKYETSHKSTETQNNIKYSNQTMAQYNISLLRTFD